MSTYRLTNLAVTANSTLTGTLTVGGTCSVTGTISTPATITSNDTINISRAGSASSNAFIALQNGLTTGNSINVLVGGRGNGVGDSVLQQFVYTSPNSTSNFYRLFFEGAASPEIRMTNNGTITLTGTVNAGTITASGTVTAGTINSGDLNGTGTATLTKTGTATSNGYVALQAALASTNTLNILVGGTEGTTGNSTLFAWNYLASNDSGNSCEWLLEGKAAPRIKLQNNEQIYCTGQTNVLGNLTASGDTTLNNLTVTGTANLVTVPNGRTYEVTAPFAVSGETFIQNWGIIQETGLGLTLTTSDSTFENLLGRDIWVTVTFSGAFTSALVGTTTYTLTRSDGQVFSKSSVGAAGDAAIAATFPLAIGQAFDFTVQITPALFASFGNAVCQVLIH